MGRTLPVRSGSWALVLFVLSSWAWAQSDDAPDEALEERFHWIYEKFNSEPTAEQTWNQLTTEKQVEKYSVQAGDTLWDISSTLFGNGHFWPKLWQLNDRITNPHIIFPGKTLKFTPGTEAEPPSLNVAEAEPAAGGEAPSETPEVPETPDAPAVAEGATAEPENEEGGPVVPPPTSESSRAVLTQLPPSLPNLLGGIESGEYSNTGFSVSYATPPPVPYKYITSYLSDDEPKEAGEVVEVDTRGEVAFEGQHVFIHAESGLSGSYVKFYRFEKAPNNPVSGDKMGYVVTPLGEAKLVGEVDPKEKIYRALVTKTLGHVRVGDHVGLGRLEKFKVMTDGRHSGVKARIVGGEFAPDRKFLWQGSLVYLDVGLAGGIEAGSILPVYRRETLRQSDLEEVPPVAPAGKLLVVKASNSRATAWVISSSDALRPGDYTGEMKP